MHAWTTAGPRPCSGVPRAPSRTTGVPVPPPDHTPASTLHRAPATRRGAGRQRPAHADLRENRPVSPGLSGDRPSHPTGGVETLYRCERDRSAGRPGARRCVRARHHPRPRPHRRRHRGAAGSAQRSRPVRPDAGEHSTTLRTVVSSFVLLPRRRQGAMASRNSCSARVVSGTAEQRGEEDEGDPFDEAALDLPGGTDRLPRRAAASVEAVSSGASPLAYRLHARAAWLPACAAACRAWPSRRVLPKSTVAPTVRLTGRAEGPDQSRA
jgi:hypothetical protein